MWYNTERLPLCIVKAPQSRVGIAEIPRFDGVAPGFILDVGSVLGDLQSVNTTEAGQTPRDIGRREHIGVQEQQGQDERQIQAQLRNETLLAQEREEWEMQD